MKLKEQVSFLTQILQLLRYGRSLREVLEQLKKYSVGTSKNIAEDALKKMQLGSSPIDALEGYYPQIIVKAISVSFETGNLSSGLESSIMQLSSGTNIIQRFLKMCIVPLFIFPFIGTIAIMVSNKMLEIMTEQSGFAFSVNEFVQKFGPLIYITIFSLIALVLASLKVFHGPIRQKLDSFPVFTLYRIATASTFLSTVGNLLNSGMKLNDILNEISTSSYFPYLNSHIQTMQSRLSQGESNFGIVFSTGLFLPIEEGMLRVLGSEGVNPNACLESSITHSSYVSKKISTLELIIPKVSISLAIILLLAVVAPAITAVIDSTQL